MTSKPNQINKLQEAVGLNNELGSKELDIKLLITVSYKERTTRVDDSKRVSFVL